MISDKGLRRKLAEAEADVAAYRRVLALMNGDGRATKAKGMAKVLRDAIAADGARRATHGPVAAGGFSERAKAKRRETLKALAMIEKHGAMTGEAIAEASGVKPGWIGPMVSRGYFTGKKGGEYRRTKKPFHVDPKQAT